MKAFLRIVGVVALLNAVLGLAFLGAGHVPTYTPWKVAIETFGNAVLAFWAFLVYVDGK